MTTENIIFQLLFVKLYWIRTLKYKFIETLSTYFPGKANDLIKLDFTLVCL